MPFIRGSIKTEMKILNKDLKNGKIMVQAQSLDDLWCLSHIIGKGNTVIGKTTRKVRLGTAEEAVKKTYTLSIAVEEVKFEDQSLRLSGVTTESKEDVPRGAHHTITLEPNETLTITKEKWQKYQLDRLEQATKEQLKALIVVFDRETALLAKLKSSGFEIVTELTGKVKKKDYRTTAPANFYKEIISAVKDYDDRNKPDRIILASPAFWKEELLNELQNEPKAKAIKEKAIMATCSSVGENAIEEVLKRPEMETVLENAIAAREMRLVEEIMTEIAREGKVAYGRREVESAVNAGAAEKIAITDKHVYKDSSLEKIMKTTEESGAKVFIINSENAAGQKLDSLGGIAAILRYKIY